MHIEADYEACIGAGQCVLAAAEVFDQGDEDGVVILLTTEPRPDQYEMIRQAGLLCPTRAIRFHE